MHHIFRFKLAFSAGSLLALLLALVFAAGCSDDNAVSSGPPATPTYLAEHNPYVDHDDGTRTIDPIDSTIMFHISRAVLPGSNPPDTVLIVHQWSLKMMYEYNNSILQAVTTDEGRIDFVHEGFHRPDCTQDALGPSHTWSYFDIPDGRYGLSFRSGQTHDLYTLYVHGSDIQVRPIRTSYTRLSRGPYNENIWWLGYDPFCDTCRN